MVECKVPAARIVRCVTQEANSKMGEGQRIAGSMHQIATASSYTYWISAMKSLVISFGYA